MSRLAAALLGAALLLAAAADPAEAQTGPGTLMADPLMLSYGNYTELAALQLALRVAVDIGSALAAGKEPDPRVTASAAPPEGVTAAMLGTALGQVLAAASLDSEALSTLGDPIQLPMGYGDRHALFRLPPQGIRIRGTCVFIHGCYHSPESWFYRSRKCPTCTGLPEEVAHTKQCLARGYAVLAVASKDRTKEMCFSSSGDPALSDQGDVKAVVQKFTQQFKLNRMPIYMWGISSGAGFAIKFPATMYIDGIVSEVNMPWEKSWGVTNGAGVLKVRFPPTAYYMMQRDLQTKRQIEKAVDILRKNGVNSDYVYIPSQPLYPSYFQRRSIYISRQQSAQIVAGLKKIGAINEDGWLNYDPRMVPKWMNQLRKVLPWVGNRADPYYNLNTDESQITEAMNFAWAWHEIVGEHVRPTLMWLEARGKANLTALCEEYSLQGNIACLTERREGCPGIVKPIPSPPPPRPPSPRPKPRPPSPKPPRPTSPPARRRHPIRASRPPPMPRPRPPPAPSPPKSAGR